MYGTVADELTKGLARGEIYYLKTIWDRYCELLSDFGITPGVYRSQHFKSKLEQLMQGNASFVRPLNPRYPLLVFPIMTARQAMQRLKSSMDEVEDIDDGLVEMASATRVSDNKDNELLSWLYWVALKIKADIRDCPTHDIIGNIDVNHVESQIPDSLYLLLRLLCTRADYGDVIDEDQDIKKKILSIAQDIVFVSSGGRKNTPKHIGIGLTIHQATRSKGLVELLHAAGHCISYESVLRIDSTVAYEVLKRYSKSGEVFVPLNFVNTRLSGNILYANDKIDINVETLDGKGTIHASQTAAFRPIAIEEETPRISLKSGVPKSVDVPPTFFLLNDSKMGSKNPSPLFNHGITIDM